MFSRLSGLANTVLHELSGDGEGLENVPVSDPVAESSSVEKMSEDQMETLAHYEQLVIQLKELIQQKDVEIQQKDTELQEKETQHKLEKEASDAKIAKLKLQAKAKLTALNKQIEELKKTATTQVPLDGQDASSKGQKETQQSEQNNEGNTSILQETVNDLTKQLHDSQRNISELTKQLSESQETITTLNHQLQDSQENITDLKRALQESGDAARELHKKQETEIHNLQRKLEEQSEALGSRTQVVQMLEQELQNAELQKQVLSEQYREMERELLSQKESAQQIIAYQEMLRDKDNAYHLLQEELDKEKSVNSQLQSLREEVKRGMQAQEELERVKNDLEVQMEARKQAEDARQELENKLQEDRMFRVQMESGIQEELEALRAELDKAKMTQKEMEQLRSQLENQKEAQEEELTKLRSELTRSKELDKEVQQLRVELDERKASQEQLNMELERLNHANNLLMEKEKDSPQDVELSSNSANDPSVQLENVRSELKNTKESIEELSRLREELESMKESLADFDQVKGELEKGRETLIKLDLMKQELQNIREAEILADTMQQEMDKQLEKVKGHQLQVSGMDTDINREEITQQKSVMDEDAAENVKEADEQNDGERDEAIKAETDEHNDSYRDEECVNEVLGKDGENETDRDEVNLQEVSEKDGQNDTDRDEVNVQEVSEKDGQNDTDRDEVNVQEVSEKDGQNDTDRDEVNINEVAEKDEQNDTVNEVSKTDGPYDTDRDEVNVNEVSGKNVLHTAEELPQLSVTSFKENILETQSLFPLEDHLESVTVQTEQMLQSSVVNVQSHSVSQELVVNVTGDDIKEKQLSILLLDLVDTQEEVNRLKEQMNMEQESFSSTSHTTLITELTEHLVEGRKLEECSDIDIQSLNEQVKELKCHLEAVTSEKDVLTLRIQDLVQEQKQAESLQSSNFESQNILAEKLNSLEIESKSKDLKITALQKDLDDLNLQLSEQNTIFKLQENHLEENKKNTERLKEMLNLSQGKEERLSEALAAYERDIVTLQEQLSQKAEDIETLQQSLAEKEQQISEVSHSLSDKVVLLNEEKFSLVKELKALKEQLIVQENGREEESTENIRTANAELNLQKEMLMQEKSDLEELLKSIQAELGEVKSQLEDVSSRYIHSQEILKSVQEERKMFHVQIEDQRSEFLFKQKELEELQIQVENHKYAYEQNLQLLTEKHQSSLNDIRCLQEEKDDLEHQLKHYINKIPEDDCGAGIKEKEELQIQVENQKKEVEQLKRKLQAALVSRKELAKKVSKLEEDLVKYRNDKGLDSEVILAVQPSNLKSEQEVVSSQINDEFLKSQLVGLESELEQVRRELTDKSAANEQLQILIDELQGKSKSLATEPTERIPSEKSDNPSIQLNTEERANMFLQLENRIIQLEQEKESLHKKAQEALNSRRDTIKKAQEKDRHHREQLKQQKEEFNLLQGKLEKLQRHQKSDPDTDRIFEERAMQTEIPYPIEKLCNDSSHRAEGLISVVASQDSSDKSNWREEWVDFLPEKIEDTVVQKSPSTDMSLDSYKMQLDLFQSQKNELQLKAMQLEEKLDERFEEVSHLRDSIDHLTTQLQQEKDKCQGLEMQASILKSELEKNKLEISNLQEFTIKSVKDELIHKEEKVGQLQQELEEINIAIKNADELISEKDNIILSLKSQMELQTKDYEERYKKLEEKVEEVQQKQDDVEGEKGKQQLQRKLQAALISRKDALKESKSLKLELETIKAQNKDLTNRLQATEGLVSELNLEKETLLNTLTGLKEERDKLIMEIDKCLLENQNLEASCESLKLALVGITQDKEDLNKELESLKMSHDSKTSEYQDKLSDLQKEYETLLQSYENVSDETDRMKRAVEMVKQEKQELFSKMLSVEGKKKDVENQLEESQMEIENMKEKMRKFAKSKQQKILELEEENDRLRGELQQATDVQKSELIQEDGVIVKEELIRVQTENSVLKSELEQVKSEKENLKRDSEALKLQLHNAESDLQKVLEEHNTEIREKEVINKTEALELTHSGPEHRDKLAVGEGTLEMLTENAEKQKAALEKNSQLEEVIEKLKTDMEAKENEMEKINKFISSLQEKNLGLDAQLSSSQDVINKMEKDLADLKINYETVVLDLEQANKQKQALEIEKDELEERLMNQMAELNGSIGNFQQDAVDLQFKNESLQQKLEELQLQLEEEKRQMERQKAEALSEVHKEYVEKLKSVHEGEKGRKTQSEELQELLKEKQQEVRQLQKDCIQYQETISQLERTFKALEFVHSECEKEKIASSDKVAKAVADTKKAQADLTTVRVLLDDTQSEAARVLAENVKMKKEIQIVRDDITVTLKRKEEDMKKKLEDERAKNLKEMVNLQAKISLIQQDKEQLEGSIKSLQDHLEEKNQEIKDLQGNLNQNIAKLAAFTRSMCSLQDDRDRVIEESKKWNEKFSDELQKKDDEIQDKERICMELKKELLQVTSQVDELQSQISRLQLENEDLVTEGQIETESLAKTRDCLLEEKAILSSKLEEEQNVLFACQEELKLRSQEATDRLSQLESLNIEVTQFKHEKENLLDTIQRLQAEVQDLKLHNEQTQSDLQASKTLTEQLHKELEQKEQDVMRLLSARDEAVSAAVGELHELHAIQFKALEERLEEAEKERQRLQGNLEELKTRLKTTQEEANQSRAQLQAFTKSMCSLQEERERLLGDYQQLEQRHLDAILAKDGLIQEAAAESNSLREELRFLRSRTDDLNAQNAKLNAQLTRYREDLNEVISLKDSQLKQLLGEKLLEIEKLRNEQNNQELLLNQEKGQRDALQQELDEIKKEKQRSLEQVDSLTSSISELQTEKETLRKKLEQLEEELQTLKEDLLQKQKELEDLKEEALTIKAEAEKRVQHAEDELNKKLQSIQHDTGILRNETETAEERVAELARDLMDAEQRLLHANEENSSLKAQIQAFGGSMRSLQDSHDIAQEEIKNLQKQLKEALTLNEDLTSVKTERDNLSVMLSESKEEHQRVQIQLNQLTSNFQAREEEIRRLTADFQASQMQLRNMSKAMGSLQEDRDRLQLSLKTPPREIQRTLQSSYQRDSKNSNDHPNSSLQENLQSTQEEMQTLRAELGDTLAQVHQKELRIQQLNVKLSQIFEEKNSLSLQLHESSQNMRDAMTRCYSLEQQLNEMHPKSSEALLGDSAPGAPQERKEPQTEADQQLMELQQRYLELKQQSTEHEHVRSVLEQQLREERQRAEDRIQELEENMNRMDSQNWSVQEERATPHELSLLMEPQDTPNVKARSSSMKRLLRLVFCSRTKTPLLASLYLLLIHALLLLCLTGHL